MKRHLLIGALALGLYAAPSAADPVADVLYIVEHNLDPTTIALIEGVADTSVTLMETASAVQTSAALGDTLVNAGSALVSGTGEFGQLGFGFLLANLAVQTNLNPFLTAIDDPSAENFNAVFNPDDLAVIAANLPAAVEGAWAPDDSVGGIQRALTETLQGNLVDPGLFGGPSTFFSTVNGVGTGTLLLIEGTNYGSSGANLALGLAVAGLLGNGLAAAQLQPTEDALVPVFEALEPVTTPVIAAIEASEVPEIPEF